MKAVDYTVRMKDLGAGTLCITVNMRVPWHVRARLWFAIALLRLVALAAAWQFRVDYEGTEPTA